MPHLWHQGLRVERDDTFVEKFVSHPLCQPWIGSFDLNGSVYAHRRGCERECDKRFAYGRAWHAPRFRRGLRADATGTVTVNGQTFTVPADSARLVVATQ
jgi:hypothetical protein